MGDTIVKLEGQIDGSVISATKFDNGDVGISIELRKSPLAEAMSGGGVLDNASSVGISGGIPVIGGGLKFKYDPVTQTRELEVKGHFFGVSGGFAISRNPKNGTSIESGRAGVGGSLGLQVEVLGSKFGGIAELDYGLSYEKTSGAFVGTKSRVNYGILGLGEVDGKFKFGKQFQFDIWNGSKAEAFNESGITTYNAMGDFGPLYQEPNARSAPPPSNGPAGELKVVQPTFPKWRAV